MKRAAACLFALSALLALPALAQVRAPNTVAAVAPPLSSVSPSRGGCSPTNPCAVAPPALGSALVPAPESPPQPNLPGSAEGSAEGAAETRAAEASARPATAPATGSARADCPQPGARGGFAGRGAGRGNFAGRAGRGDFAGRGQFAGRGRGEFAGRGQFGGRGPGQGQGRGRGQATPADCPQPPR